jgi:hypothetical protein
MAGFNVDPAELGRSAGAAHRAAQSLTGAGPLTEEVDQAAPRLVDPNLIGPALAIADSTGRTFAEGSAVLAALSTGLRFAAENYHVADKVTGGVGGSEPN